MYRWNWGQKERVISFIRFQGGSGNSGLNRGNKMKSRFLRSWGPEKVIYIVKNHLNKCLVS